MIRPVRNHRWRLQCGIAAIEMAVILPVLMIMVAFSLFFGRVFWHYTVAQKAAHDAARYLSSVPPIEFRTPARTESALAVARAIAEEETAGLNPGPYAPVISFQCDTVVCAGFTQPATIRVIVQLAMFDQIFYSETSDIIGATPLPLTASVTMSYVGR